MNKFICELCGIEFDKKCPNQKYCADCRNEANIFKVKLYRSERKAIKSYSKCQQAVDTLEEKCKEIALYNRIHGTRYSYGEYTALERLGRI